jgi:acetoin utilization protein AcuB
MPIRHPKRSIRPDVRTRRPLHPDRERDELDATQWPEAAIRVKDCMSRSAATIHSDALVRGAIDMMKKRRIRHLPVVDRENNLVGIVTDRDLRQMVFDPVVKERLGELVKLLATMTVRDVMTWGVVTVNPDSDIRHAARLMREQRIGSLPVVEGDRVVGIITETDVLRVFQDVLDNGVVSKPYRWAFAYR